VCSSDLSSGHRRPALPPLDSRHRRSAHLVAELREQVTDRLRRRAVAVRAVLQVVLDDAGVVVRADSGHDVDGLLTLPSHSAPPWTRLPKMMPASSAMYSSMESNSCGRAIVNGRSP